MSIGRLWWSADNLKEALQGGELYAPIFGRFATALNALASALEDQAKGE